MCYMYVEGDIYLGMSNNNYAPVKDVNAAKKFSTKEQASNVFKSCVPKILRRNYNWSLQEFEGMNVDNTEKINDTYTPVDLAELKTTLNDLASKFSTLKGNKEWLLDQQSGIDKQINDILHFIEFEKFSACEGFKLCRALKELRLKRRKVKNELELINIINCHTCNNMANGSTNKAIASIENKQYAPRILSELFENRNIDSILKIN